MLKKAFIFVSIFTFISCGDSVFSIKPSEIFTDSEGNPIVNPDENIENQELGLENSYCYGFSTPSDQQVAEIEIPTNLPSSVDLSNFLPVVGNQGQQGSCVGWATGYYLKSFQENYQDANTSHLMSPAFVYNQIKVGSCADGSQIQSAFELIEDKGIVNWNEMPYNQNDCETQPTEDQFNKAIENKIKSYYYLNGDILFEQAKAFLANEQPLVIAISIDRTYFGAIDSNGDAVYRNFKKVDGAHAMLVIGYDDDKKAFKAVNSWGTSWGNNGFVWIDYKAFEEVLNVNSNFKILCEVWVSEDIITPVL